MKKILVVDGNSIINRAFYGIRPLTTRSGKHTNAIYGMINIISKQLTALSPDYAAVAFDLKHPTFRHQMYTEYKAGRHPTPEELLSQFDDAKECLRLMGLSVLELPGYEADDIQGTVATMAHSASEQTEAYILTGDRDLLQLIDDKISVLLVKTNDTVCMKTEQFVDTYGILPSQFVDMKALMGDSSDNIPGVAGVGEKTAANLIKAFSTLDGIYENIESKEISKGVREKLIRDKDNAYLSRRLAKITVEAPIEKSLEELRYSGPDKKELYKKFVELELNSFISRFGLDTADTEDAKIQKSDAVEYLDADAARILASDGRVAIEIRDEKLYLYNKMEEHLVFSGDFSEVSSLFENREIVCYDAKSLLHALKKRGVRVGENLKLLDIMLYGYLLNPGSATASVLALSAEFLSESITADLPFADVLMRLEPIIREKLSEMGMLAVLDELELPLAPILFEIEDTGFKINRDGMNEYGDALSALSNDLKTRIYMQAGGEFNINSPKQLGEVLFEKLGLPTQKKTKSGYSTDAATLEELRPFDPIIDDILEYRQVTKLIGTYAQALPQLADGDDRIHTEFKQALTATGRLSSTEPNLQNIPIKTKMGREMRRYFIAKEGYTLVDADYSQIELRLLAHISEDYNMSEAFRDGKDIHRKTAAAVFGLPEEAVNEEMRKRAKAVNFGIIYGISGFSLSKDIGTTPKEATKYIKSYLMNYPGIDSYLERVVAEASERGYTCTPMGRRRYIPELKSSNGNMRAFGKRIAMNAPIQGAAADIMKLAMIRVYNALKKELPDAKIVMQVHDELIIEVKKSESELCAKIVKREMENAQNLSVPLTVDVTVGDNWLEQE